MKTTHQSNQNKAVSPSKRRLITAFGVAGWLLRGILSIFTAVFISGCSRSNRLRSRPARAKQMP